MGIFEEKMNVLRSRIAEPMSKLRSGLRMERGNTSSTYRIKIVYI